MTLQRRPTRAVEIDGVTIGGGAPVVVQSMTNTDTADAAATAAQVAELARAGSELVRITVNTEAAAKAVPAIREPLDAQGVAINIGDPGEAMPQRFAFDWLLRGEGGAFEGRAAGFNLRLDQCDAPAQAIFDACQAEGDDDCLLQANRLLITCSRDLIAQIASLRVWGVDGGSARRWCGRGLAGGAPGQLGGAGEGGAVAARRGCSR